MDPVEILMLCKEGAVRGSPSDIIVPRMFSAGEYEDMWKRSPVQVREILDEILCAKFPGDGLELLMKSGALFALMPELAQMKGLGDDPVASMHKDVWEHTKTVVSGVPANVELRWSALMHDIGKARTRKVVGRKVSFHNHDVVGARMVDDIEKRLGLFGNDVVLLRTVRTLVLNHLRPASYRKNWTDSGIRRIIADLGGMREFQKLMQLSRADLTTKNVAKRNVAIERGNELVKRVAEVFAADNAPKLPKGVMGVILSKTAAKPGAWCNAVRDELESMLKEGLLLTNQETDYYVVAGLKLIEINAYA